MPLIPIALATGWSSLFLFILQIPLNPMSATLGALVIAISTEFAVLLSARYRSERAEGLEPVAALSRTYERTGAAVLASGVTVIAGFAALLVSGFPMLRDFGAVTVVNLTVSLLGVMIVLPAALMWAEQRGPLRVPRSRAELAALRTVGRGRAARRRGRPARGPCAARRPCCEGRRRRAAGRTITQVTAMDRDPFDDEEQREADAEKARGAARPYSIAVGVLFLGLIVFAGINTLTSDSPGPVGLQEGKRLPAFAAPSATGPARRRLQRRSRRRPARSACRDAIRICDYFDRPLVLVAWFSKCGGHCEPVLDSVERSPAALPAAWASSASTSGTPRTRRARPSRSTAGGSRWRSTATGPSGCCTRSGSGPTTFFAYRGGVLASKALGELTEEELIDRVRRLERTSRERQDGARIKERRGS